MGLLCHKRPGLGKYLFGGNVIPAAAVSAKMAVRAVEGDGVRQLGMVTPLTKDIYISPHEAGNKPPADTLLNSALIAAALKVAGVIWIVQPFKILVISALMAVSKTSVLT
jgi:hypothetical protein